MAAGGAHFVAILSSDRLNRQTEGRPQKKNRNETNPNTLRRNNTGRQMAARAHSSRWRRGKARAFDNA